MCRSGQHLDLPIAERNRLLLAGDFAPPYLELPYDGEVMPPLRESLSGRHAEDLIDDGGLQRAAVS